MKTFTPTPLEPELSSRHVQTPRTEPGRVAVKNSSAMAKVIGDIRAHMKLLDDRAASRHLDADDQLARLVGRVGPIASTARRQEAIRRVGAATFAWLEGLHQSPEQIFIQVADERLRQRKLFAAHKLPFRVDSADIGWPLKLRVLAEEIGEVAAAVDHLDAHPQSRKHRNHLVEELIQVAAVAVAWLESFEGTTNRDLAEPRSAAAPATSPIQAS